MGIIFVIVAGVARVMAAASAEPLSPLGGNLLHALDSLLVMGGAIFAP